MFQDDFILREIQGLTRFLAKTIFHKDVHTDSLIDGSGVVSGEGYFRHSLFKLLSDGEINQAENLLHQQLEADPSHGYLAIAVEFYGKLATLDDGELAVANFSREEIGEGLEAVKRIYGIEWL